MKKRIGRQRGGAERRIRDLSCRGTGRDGAFRDYAGWGALKGQQSGPGYRAQGLGSRPHDDELQVESTDPLHRLS